MSAVFPLFQSEHIPVAIEDGGLSGFPGAFHLGEQVVASQDFKKVPPLGSGGRGVQDARGCGIDIDYAVAGADEQKAVVDAPYDGFAFVLLADDLPDVHIMERFELLRHGIELPGETAQFIAGVIPYRMR